MKGGMFLKKVLVVLMLVALLVGFSGCSVKQTGTTPSNPSSETQTKVVRIDSEPQGATVFVDDNYVVRAPADIELTLGKHNVTFDKDGYERYTLENVEVKGDTPEIKVVLKKIEDANVIKRTETKLSETLLKAPSKLVFASNGALYIGDEKGKEIQKVAVLGSNYQVQILGASPDSKWVVLEMSPKNPNDYTYQFLYALNTETLELIKIAKDCWEGSFKVSFELGDDKLLYGFQGVNAPICSLASFDLSTRKVLYLLDCSKNPEEKAFEYDVSPDAKYIAYAGGKVEIFPDNRTALYLKNLETGELRVLVKPSNLNENLGDDYISSVEFVNGYKEILYSRTINAGSSTYNPTTKYYIVDFEGNNKEISPEEASKLTKDTQELLETGLKKFLNKNLYINAVLNKCSKIVFTIVKNDSMEELYICNTDFSNVIDTGISNPDFTNFSCNSCKFTCEVLLDSGTSGTPRSSWYLIDAMNNTKINLNDFLKMPLDDTIYIEK